MKRPPLGDQELEVLQFVARHAPAPASRVAEQFGVERGLARTTVLTVLERLRRKGYLARRRRAGVFHYAPRLEQSEVLGGLVQRFFEQTLSGSVSPVVAYLANTRRISDEELGELEQLVEQLRSEREAAGTPRTPGGVGESA
jgi:predicted transcriptional regulator